MSNHQFRNLALAGAAAYGGYKIWQHFKGANNEQFSCSTPRRMTPNDIIKYVMEKYYRAIDKKAQNITLQWFECDMIQLEDGNLIGFVSYTINGSGSLHFDAGTRVGGKVMLVLRNGEWFIPDQNTINKNFWRYEEASTERATQEAAKIIAQAEREAEREAARKAVEKRDRAYNASIAEEKIKLLGMRYAEITAGSSHPNPGECLKEGADIIPDSDDDQRIKDLSFDEVFEKIVDDEWFDGSLNAIQSNTLEFPISLSHGTSSIVLMAARIVAMKTGKTDFTWFLADHLTDTEVNEISDNMHEDKNKCVYIASWHKIKPKHEKLLRDAFSKCKNFGLIKGFPSQVARHEHDNGIEQRYEQIKEAELDSKRKEQNERNTKKQEKCLSTLNLMIESEEFQSTNSSKQYNKLIECRDKCYIPGGSDWAGQAIDDTFAYFLTLERYTNERRKGLGYHAYEIQELLAPFEEKAKLHEGKMKKTNRRAERKAERKAIEAERKAERKAIEAERKATRKAIEAEIARLSN